MATTSDDAGDGKGDDESSGQRTGPSFASASLDARDAADGDVEEGLIMPCAGAADAQGRGPFQVWIKEFNGQRYTITCDSKFTVPAPNLVVRAHNGDLTMLASLTEPLQSGIVLHRPTQRLLLLLDPRTMSLVCSLRLLICSFGLCSPHSTLHSFVAPPLLPPPNTSAPRAQLTIRSSSSSAVSWSNRGWLLIRINFACGRNT